MHINSITPAALYERMKAGEPVELIDVRTPGEFEAMHAVGARSVPLDTLSRDAVLAGGRNGTHPIYVICQAGSRSAAACARLMQQGVDNVVNVEGGTSAWQRAGLPVEGSGGGTARWLRAGGLVGVAVSVLLGIFVHSSFLWAAAGVWLALIVSGNGPCCSAGSCAPRR